MASLDTEIQFISPQKTIIIKKLDAGGLGCSDPYQLSVKLNVRPRSNPLIDVDFVIKIENSMIYSFEDGSSVKASILKRVKSGDVRLSEPFQIKNLVPLVGMQLVLFIESNDVDDADNKDFDSETYDVESSK